MRVFVFLIAFPIVFSQDPKCMCNSGTFYPSSTLTSTFNPAQNRWEFQNCQSPNSAHVACTDGTSINEVPYPENVNNTALKLPGVITAACIKSTHNFGLLTTNISYHSSACCAACRPGFRLDVVLQGGSPVGYICKPQTCEDGTVHNLILGLNTRPNSTQHPTCKCNYNAGADPKNTFFSTEFEPRHLDEDIDPQELKAETTSSVFVTSEKWHEIPLQKECLDFDGVCSSPQNCADNSTTQQQNCVDSNQPWATLCKKCKDGYNKKNVQCTNLNSDWTDGIHKPRNKCHACVRTTVGCSNGNIVT